VSKRRGSQAAPSQPAGEIAFRAKLARQHVTGEPAVRRDRNSAVSIFDAESRYANASVATAVQALPDGNELRRLERCDVFADHVARGTTGDNSPSVEKVGPSAERGDGGSIVAHEEHSAESHTPTATEVTSASSVRLGIQARALRSGDVE